MQNIWTYVELEDGKPTDMSLQCLAKGRQLADAKDGSLVTIALGDSVDPQPIIAHGADIVHVAEHPLLANYLPGPYVSVLADVLTNAEAVFFPASTQGNDLAAKVAAKLGVGCVNDCHGVDWQGNGLTLTRLEYDNKVHTHYAVETSPQIATLHDGITEIPQPDDARQGETRQVEVALDDADVNTEVVRREIAAKTVNLRDARIIVAGGAGVGTKENFALVQELAETLGGEVGATRPVVDAGWTDYERQIGQTGTTVRPDLYIACGISGAVQHRVGMMDSGKIVAINNDPNAPIFRFAHVKIVADLSEVIPKLIRLYKGG